MGQVNPMSSLPIHYLKWDKTQFREFQKSCIQHLQIKSSQIYQPYYSLFFNIHNTKNSHSLFDIQRRFQVLKINSIQDDFFHNSNTLVEATVYDRIHQVTLTQTLFCKCIPLLDPLSYLMNHYNNQVKRNPLLPSAYNYNTFEKINDIDNMAYIDTFFSYIASELTLQDKLPCFPIFYGSVNGIKEAFKYDITDDYTRFENKSWFYKDRGKSFSVNLYISSDEEEEAPESGDYIAMLNDFPCQNFFIEPLEGTIEDFLKDKDNVNISLLQSCLFQTAFALAYLQKHFQFTHNDLHINNIMYKSTEKSYIYYKFNNTYFKVPTHGYIFKIIDFGRSIFTFHKKQYFNDSFKKHGEAGGQYDLPYDKLLFPLKEKIVKPNFHFDLCRLSITILDELNYSNNEETSEPFFQYLYSLTYDESNQSLYELYDDFDLYISIAKYANQALPRDCIQHSIFQEYRIPKKQFPKKLYYSL